MNQEMKKIEVVAAVIFNDGKVFATQRGHGEFKDEHEAAKWLSADRLDSEYSEPRCKSPSSTTVQ